MFPSINLLLENLFGNVNIEKKKNREEKIQRRKRTLRVITSVTIFYSKKWRLQKSGSQYFKDALNSEKF